MSHDINKIRKVINRSPAHPGSLITVLQDIQKEFRYLPCEALHEAAKILGVPLSKVYSASTFYKAFSLTPKGKNIIRICKGTACHIKGADDLIAELEKELKIKEGETSKDLKYTLEIVNCVGACAMAPVMIVNDKYHGNVKSDIAIKSVKKG
ncbi:MAG: NAD(P)H-dependent oxidoreductase subunit E [Candidatus Zixiibacteriota bacterium]